MDGSTSAINSRLGQQVADGTVSYLYGNGRVAQANLTQTAYFLGDALGSVRHLVDSAGQVTLARSYEPYGDVLTSAGGGVTSYSFTGEWRDGSGLIYLRARYYASGTGRFMTRDPWAGAIQLPRSLNHWQYVYSNPVLFSDHTGLRGRLDWEKFRSIILKYHHIDIASDGEDGIGAYNKTTAARAIRLVTVNFEDSGADVQCYTNDTGLDRDYNRYDRLFSGWVDYWKWRGKRDGHSVPESLTPSLAKAVAMLESTLGYRNENGDGVMQVTWSTAGLLAGKTCTYNETGSACVPGTERMDKKTASLGWGYINTYANAPDKYQPTPAESIGAGVRWLIYEYVENANMPTPDSRLVEGYSDPTAIQWLNTLYAYNKNGAIGSVTGLPFRLTYARRVWGLYTTGILNGDVIFVP